MSKVTRGGAAPDRQLSKLQRHILLWLYFQETDGLENRVYERVGDWSMVRLRNAIAEERKTIARIGISWSSEFCYGITPTKAQTAALSRALHRLEKRGLVILLSTSAKTNHKLSHTTHVKLTKFGRQPAAHLYLKWKDGISTSEESL